MLTLLALVSTAVAGDDPLADEIRSLQTELGGPMLLCVAGEEAEQVTRRTLRDLGQEDLPITRVPTVGDVDAEMARALDAGGLACGLRIAPTEGGFDLTRHGACTGIAGEIEPTPPDADPTESAASDAQGGPPDAEGAPAITAEAPAEPTEGEWAAREARYQRDRLMLVDLPPDPTLPDGVTWEVIDGRGSSLSAHSLVAIAQDQDLVMDLDRELKRSKTSSKIMFWTGVGLAVLSPVPLLGVEGGAISANQDRAWSSVFLLASGALTVSLARAPRKAVRSRQQHPALYLDGDMAEDVVVVHNHQLYGSLDLENRPPPPEEEPPPGDEASDGAAAPGETPLGTDSEGVAPTAGEAGLDAPAPDDAAAEAPAAKDPEAKDSEAKDSEAKDPGGAEAADAFAPPPPVVPEGDDGGDDLPESADAPAEDAGDDNALPGEAAPETGAVAPVDAAPDPAPPAESTPTAGGEGAASDR